MALQMPDPVDPDAPWLFPTGTLEQVEERLAAGGALLGITVSPMSEHIGCTVAGLDLSQPIAPEAAAVMRAALLKYKVMAFKEQFLTHEQHVAAAAALGEVTIAHISLGGLPEKPEVFSLRRVGRDSTIPMGGDAAAPSRGTDFSGQMGSAATGVIPSRGYGGWHSDITAALNPPAVSILRAEKIPSVNGDTRWTNLAVAFEKLPEHLKQKVEGLRGVHFPSSTWPGPHALNRSKQAKPGEKEIDLVSEHPIVTVHPETGEKVLNVSASFLKHIKGMGEEESEELLNELWAHATQDHLTTEHRWSAGDIVFWDNRATMHLAPVGLPPAGEERLMYRVTVRGQPFVGADGSTSTAVSGRPILNCDDELSVGFWAGVEIVDRDSDASIKAHEEATASATAKL